MMGSTKRPPATPEPERLPTKLSLTANAVIDMEAAVDGATSTALPRFRMVAYSGGPMRVGGWRHPVIIDLAGLSIPSQSRPIRFGHDPLAGVGHTDAIRIDQGQLVATGVVSRDTAAAREVVVSSKNGFPWQASVGASVDEFEFVKENQRVLVNGQQYSGPINVVRRATLGEISFVDLGADGTTSATVAASKNLESVANPLEEGEQNMTVEETSNAGEATLAQEPVVESPAAPVAGLQTAEKIRAQAVAETERIAANCASMNSWFFSASDTESASPSCHAVMGSGCQRSKTNKPCVTTCVRSWPDFVKLASIETFLTPMSRRR